jgi:hypothetical protein
MGVRSLSDLLAHPHHGASWEAFALEQILRIALHDLKLDALYVVYPGMHRYRLSEQVEAVPLWALLPAA